ncbi:hypothetical protein ARMSODRAFT_601696 [Armillaria solidipes]|uniref:Uncharacterized protein n=1 Tax=Armillaria solidipes TaxID=1076256 RepID=A0A2H3AVG7_9AGAR|nr:hypothetical protein ARMSODRAFT_601696 [Armillaria solidipes]
MLAPRDSDDVQSQGTSCSGDSRHIGEDRSPKRVSLVTRATYQQFQAYSIGYRPPTAELDVDGQYTVMCWYLHMKPKTAHPKWRPSPQLHRIKTPTRDLLILHNKFPGITVYGAEPHNPGLSSNTQVWIAEPLPHSPTSFDCCQTVHRPRGATMMTISVE